MQTETEVRFEVSSPRDARKRLRGGRARFQEKRFEHNTVFDDSRESFYKAGKLLRLRQDDKGVRLTFKEPLPSKRFKVRNEFEFFVSDYDEAKRFLEKLGYRVSREYEKKRERWRLPGVLATLDELPFGCYMELEGSQAAIRRAAKLLGLDFSRARKDTYLDLMREKGLKRKAFFKKS